MFIKKEEQVHASLCMCLLIACVFQTKKEDGGKDKASIEDSAFEALEKDFQDVSTVMTLSFWTDRSGQTVQTQIRLLLEEQSDQGLHCLLFHLHCFDEIP